ncbi:hypothetical protein BWI17_00670 [Betaproteobacteria bacterium GR16-43]|nr:hypothetical protein BWI17_00670 [Betaproteobacteria bacterium GR16-43]
MVTLSREAVARIEHLLSGAEPIDWFLVISWRKGTADVRRTGTGEVSWARTPDEGWVAELAGWKPNKSPRDDSMPLHGDVRLLIQEHFAPGPFPGGEVYVEANEFKVRLHAI